MARAPRLFISYRASDGKAIATALARDLGQHYGAQQVFLDKDDLPAGGRWRDDVQRLIGPGSALLLVLTPDVLQARHPDGRRRIDDSDDPVRRELALALDAGALVLPLLTDGVAVPDAAGLPPPFNRLGEFTMRPLRAYDWPQDLQRLQQDLLPLGLRPPGRRRTLLAATAAGLLAAGVGAAWWATRPAPHPLLGRWRLSGAGQPTVNLDFQAGEAPHGLLMTGSRVDIRLDPAWRDYRAFWRERFQQDLDSVVWHGRGTLVVVDNSGLRRLDMAVQVQPADQPLAEPIAGGNLSAALPARDGPTLDASLWWNADQRAYAVQLQRQETR